MYIQQQEHIPSTHVPCGSVVLLASNDETQCQWNILCTRPTENRSFIQDTLEYLQYSLTRMANFQIQGIEVAVALIM